MIEGVKHLDPELDTGRYLGAVFTFSNVDPVFAANGSVTNPGSGCCGTTTDTTVPYYTENNFQGMSPSS